MFSVLVSVMEKCKHNSRNVAVQNKMEARKMLNVGGCEYFEAGVKEVGPQVGKDYVKKAE